jgi:RNA polymerase sigma-70 factor (ECF subfamily)
MTGDYDLSADIMQESFGRLLARYKPENFSKALLFRIAKNALIDEKRKRPNHHLCELDENSISENPEPPIFIRETYRDVLAAMKMLHPMERDILALKVSSDLTYREIAGIVGTSEANVKVSIHRARIKLKSILSKGDKNGLFDESLYR